MIEAQMHYLHLKRSHPHPPQFSVCSGATVRTQNLSREKALRILHGLKDMEKLTVYKKPYASYHLAGSLFCWLVALCLHVVTTDGILFQ